MGEAGGPNGVEAHARRGGDAQGECGARRLPYPSPLRVAGREAPDARRPATRDAVRARPTPCCVQRRDERRLSPALRVKQGLCFLHRE